MQALIDALPTMLGCVALTFLWVLIFGTRVALASVVFTSSVTLFALLYLIWFFRDGMGPDAITSAGVEAARRIAMLAVVPLASWLLINAISFVRYRSRQSRAA